MDPRGNIQSHRALSSDDIYDMHQGYLTSAVGHAYFEEYVMGGDNGHAEIFMTCNETKNEIRIALAVINSTFKHKDHDRTYQDIADMIEASTVTLYPDGDSEFMNEEGYYDWKARELSRYAKQASEKECAELSNYITRKAEEYLAENPVQTTMYHKLYQKLFTLLQVVQSTMRIFLG
ncbi:MAG: hypothetical protein ACK4NC_04215 [Candidatus Gracilibacteria bacterium]